MSYVHCCSASRALMGMLDWAKLGWTMMPFLGPLLRWAPVSAQDFAKLTIFLMLGGEFLARSTRRDYDGHPRMRSQIQVSLGVARDVSQQAHWMTHLLDRPIRIAGEDRTALMVKNYCFDPCLAPAGKSVIVVMMPTSYGYWQRIYGHRLYDTEQDQVAGILIDFLEGICPALRKDIEVVDVATPLSYERYTGNWQGASSGWLLSKQTMLMNLLGVETLPGLDDLYIAGQWVEPGGMVPVVAMSGRNAIRMICHHDG